MIKSPLKRNRKLFGTLLIGLFWLVGAPVHAQQSGNFREFVENILLDLGDVISIIVALSVLAMLIGVFRYSLKAGTSSEGRTDLKNYLVYGLIAMFVMLSFWGILNFLIDSFTIGGVGGGAGGSGNDNGGGSSYCDQVPDDPFCDGFEI